MLKSRLLAITAKVIKLEIYELIGNDFKITIVVTNGGYSGSERL